MWNESYYLDFVTDEGGIAGYARIGLYPNLGVTWWTTMLVGDGRPLVASVAYDLPVVGGTGLHLDAGGIEMACAVEEPLVTMRLGGTAPVCLLERPEDVYAGAPGEPTTIALDLTWTTDGVPYHYDLTTRYEVPCLVQGEVTIGSERLAVAGSGQRDHSWGERDWWAFGWCWAAARFGDGTRVHLAAIRIPGYRWPSATGSRRTVRSSRSRHSRSPRNSDPKGCPRWVAPGSGPASMTCGSSPAFGPALLESPDGRLSRFPRALARFVDTDGSSGLGWVDGTSPMTRPLCRDPDAPDLGMPHDRFGGCASPWSPRPNPPTSFVHPIRTRFAETDAMGIIHHGAYLPYLEEARAALLRHAGHPYQAVRDEGIDFAVLEVYVRYRRPLRFDEVVDLHVRLGELTRTTFQLGYLLTVAGETGPPR